LFLENFRKKRRNPKKKNSALEINPNKKKTDLLNFVLSRFLPRLILILILDKAIRIESSKFQVEQKNPFFEKKDEAISFQNSHLHTSHHYRECHNSK